MSASVSYGKVPFFTPIESPDYPIAEAADHYLWFGGRVAETVDPADYIGNRRITVEIDGNTTLLKTILKITTMILSAGILPLLALIAKIVARYNYDFALKLTDTDKSQVVKPPVDVFPVFSDAVVCNESNLTYHVVITQHDREPVEISVYPWDQVQLGHILSDPIKRDTVWSIQVYHEDKLLHNNEKVSPHIRILLSGPSPSVRVEIQSDEALLAHLNKQEILPSGLNDHHVYLVAEAMKRHFENEVSFPDNDVHLSFSNLYFSAKDELITSGKMTFFQMWHALKVIRCEEDDVLLERGAYLSNLSGSIRELASDK